VMRIGTILLAGGLLMTMAIGAARRLWLDRSGAENGTTVLRAGVEVRQRQA
jgi:hypothetical protein